MWVKSIPMHIRKWVLDDDAWLSLVICSVVRALVLTAINLSISLQYLLVVCLDFWCCLLSPQVTTGICLLLLPYHIWKDLRCCGRQLMTPVLVDCWGFSLSCKLPVPKVISAHHLIYRLLLSNVDIYINMIYNSHTASLCSL